MKLSPKRAAPTAEVPSDIVQDDVVDEDTDIATKGRPTPKRRDSAAPRGPVSAPKTRKEAYARQKVQAKAARTVRSKPAATMTPNERRAALRAGDPSVLPRRDQGATRKLARDYVDSHRMISNYLLLLFPVMIVSYLIPYVQFLVLLVLVVLIVEWNLTGRKIRKLATERFGKADGSAMSIGFYAGSRAYLPRRWRLPGPQVELGDAV